MESISSRKNPNILHLRRLGADASYRRECGVFLCDGLKLLYEALDKGKKPLTVLWKENAAELKGLEATEQYCCPAELFDYASPMKNSPGPLFTLAMPEKQEKFCFKKAILLENVQDPGNVGTVIRTAAALGVDIVFLCGACADAFSPKTLRATMGAMFRQRVLCMDTAEAVRLIRSMGIPIYAAALSERASDIRSLELANSAVAIGSEGRGLSSELLQLCDAELIIPMTLGSESLNAAVAASLAMWEMTKRDL